MSNFAYLLTTKEQQDFIKNAPVCTKEELEYCRRIVEKYRPKEDNQYAKSERYYK